MVYIADSASALSALGAKLRAARIERNESMGVFAERIGVSRPTLRDMERGAPTVQMGYWMNAFWALGRLDEVAALLPPRVSLIDRARAVAKLPRRRAAPRRKLSP
jgi:transcriptional regulator with XRE-family HTH domain